MPDKSVSELFAEYADAYGRGERPRAADYLARAGEDADELATMFDWLLRAAPRRDPTAEDAARIAALLRAEPPILALRLSRRLKRDDVVDRLLAALGLSPRSRGRLHDAYHELETAQLDPERVDESVWKALGSILSANVRDLAVWRPQPPPARATFFRKRAGGIATRAATSHHQGSQPVDEVDRLFRGVS